MVATARVYVLLIGTGLRLGEALRLTWRDIDFATGYLTVQWGKTPAARRAVLLPTVLLNQLRPLGGVGPVFDIEPHAKTVRDHHFYPLIEKLKLPWIRLHDLRHLHGSWLVA